jgi:hypothetical protein
VLLCSRTIRSKSVSFFVIGLELHRLDAGGMEKLQRMFYGAKIAKMMQRF